jgi:predicted enzyme related to lactoylglutathione lyase
VTWTLYLSSADITHTSTVFTRWGGRVLYGPAEIPGQARVLIGADPTGAVIGFWQPATPWTFHTTDPGALIWAELNTWEGALADKVFATLFGYHQQQIGDGRYVVDYTTWSRGGRTMLGRLQMNEEWAEPGIAAHWMLHFAVDPRIGIDAAVDRVLDLGGWVDIEPYDSELGRIA